MPVIGDDDLSIGCHGKISGIHEGVSYPGTGTRAGGTLNQTAYVTLQDESSIRRWGPSQRLPESTARQQVRRICHGDLNPFLGSIAVYA